MANEAHAERSDDSDELPLEPWPEPVDGRALLDELKAYFLCFVVLPKWVPQTVALWVLHTFAFELRRVATYLGVESPEKECGKTTLMTLLSKLVNRPAVAANISSPAFYRAIDELRPTLLIDEVDNLLPGNAQLRGILNAGYTQEMAYVLRITSDPVQDSGSQAPKGPKPKGGSRLARYSCWGPKAIAQIGRLPDTLRSRCILIQMQKKMPQEECKRFEEDKPLWLRLRRQCLRFVLDHAQEIAAARPVMPQELSDRSVQIWEPLVVLADLAGGDWPTLAREAAVGLSGAAATSSPIGSLLFDIWLLFATEGSGRMFSRVLVQALNSLPDRPWREKRNGKGITEAWLAEQLQLYGIRPAPMRVGQVQARGYFEADFTEVFQRYMSRSDLEAFRAKLQAVRAKPAKPEDGGEKTEDGTSGSVDQKSDPPPQTGTTPEDDAAAA